MGRRTSVGMTRSGSRAAIRSPIAMQNLLDLTGRVALVTGAGSGIGKGAAIWLAKAGARIGLVGRTKDELCAVQEEIERDGGEALCSVADVSAVAQIQKATEEIARR